jgi:hypothetical protein
LNARAWNPICDSISWPACMQLPAGPESKKGLLHFS